LGKIKQIRPGIKPFVSVDFFGGASSLAAEGLASGLLS